MVDQLALVLRGVALGLAFALVIASAWLPGRARRTLLPMVLCLLAYLVRSAPQLAEASPMVLLPLSVGALLFPARCADARHRRSVDRAAAAADDRGRCLSRS